MIIAELTITILTFFICGDCVFLGTFCQHVVSQFDPSFYYWGVTCYATAVIFALWFVIDTVFLIKRRRKKTDKNGKHAIHQRGNTRRKKKKRSYRK